MASVMLFLPVILLFALLATGMPVAFSLAISGLVGFLMTAGWRPMLGLLESVPLRQSSSYTLTTVAMFILLAEFAAASGITKQLFELASRLFSQFRGGLPIATIFSGALFGALSGSSTASAATLGSVAIPEMRERGYSRALSAGVAAIAGTLAVMIPPSVALIVYGIVTETSIGKLFLAGIIPGILTTILYGIVVVVWSWVSPTSMPSTMKRYNWKERWESARLVWPFLVVVVAVLGGIYSGVITATEAGGVGAFVTLCLWIFLHFTSKGKVRISGSRFFSAIDRTIRSTTMIIMLIIGAYFFGYYLTTTGITNSFVGYLTAVNINRYVILVIIALGYVLLGLFMSQLEILVLTLPLIYPAIVALGFDPVWFGILVVVTVEVGLVTPPVGMNVYIVAGSVRGISAEDGFKGATPFLGAQVVLLGLLMAFPSIALFLPGSSSAGG